VSPNRRSIRPAPHRRLVSGMQRWPLAILAAVALIGSGWVLRSANSTPERDEVQTGVRVVGSLRVEVLREFPHDTTAYTQGLLWSQGKLYESTGQPGTSTLRRLDPVMGNVEQRIDIDPTLFGEGLTRVGDRLIMLTWKAQQALVFDIDRFDQVGTFRYRGEGWGLCHDGRRLVMSNGSDTLTFRDPQSFKDVGEIAVTLRGQPQTRLNELECVGDEIYANVWERDYIVRINPRSGRVTHQIDAAGLLSPDEARQADVLNGIAYSPATDTFFITGKWWPKMFEVRFVE